MRSGNLKHKISIQSYGETKNAFGEVTQDFSTFKTAYASIVPISGREFLASQAINTELTHKIELRYLKGILPNMRIVFEDRIFNIQSVINIREANKTLQIMATEVVNG